jgi:CDGSH-type Zn-finger protein
MPDSVPAPAPAPASSSVRVQCKPNGPLLVFGTVTLVDPTGKEVVVPAGKPIALCRCGHSTMKPYCDGSHGPRGFQASEAAPAR